jgi:hypothetical protein
MPERWGAVRPEIAAVDLRAETRHRALSQQLAACALFAAALFGLPEEARAQGGPYAPKWHPWVEFGGLGADDDDSRGIVELWSPILQGPAALFFFDGKFQFIEDDAQEGNAQFGLRKMTPSGWNLGAWLSGDVRETDLDNTFWQVAGGLEALSVKWDLRLNGYLPVTGPQVTPSTADIVLTRNNIFMIGGEEVALHGFDGEIGYLLFGSPETKPGTRHELRVYGGGFWYDHSDAINEVAGPSTRLEWRIDDLIPDWGGSRLTFDAGYSHDDVRGDLWQVGGRLRIPLGGAKTYALLSPQSRRMQERIERDDDIVTVQSGPEKVFDTLTGVHFDRVAYVNPSITEVSDAAGDNSLLIVNGTVSGPQSLQGNQTLQAGKSTILVTGLKSGVTTSFTAPGSTAHLIDPGDDSNLTLLGSNTHVAGLNIVGAGQFSGVGEHGIFGGSDKNNIVIEQTSTSEVNIDGIHFEDNNRNVSIFDATIARAGNSGIYFNNGNRNVTIANTAITDTESDSISFIDFNRNVTIFGVDIADSAFHGIFFNDENRNVTIAGTTVTGTDVDGIQFNDDNRNVIISGATITDAGNNGIRFVDSNSNVTIEDTTIDGAGGDGIRFGNLNSNVTISGMTITDVKDGSGIAFNNTNTGVTIAGTTIRDVKGDPTGHGIFFVQGNDTVNIAGVTVDGTENDGIFFSINNHNIAISDTVIAHADRFGIDFGINNSGTVVRTTIADSEVGMRLGSSNGIAFDDSTLAGTFGGDGIFVSGANNTLNGAGNTAANATFPAGNLCEDNGNAWTGTVIFDGVAITSANCP